MRDQPRIRQFLALLRWPGPHPDQTRYMTIEPTNEYRDRPVLPDPSTFDQLPPEHQLGQAPSSGPVPVQSAERARGTQGGAGQQRSPASTTTTAPQRRPSISREERDRRRREALESLAVGEWREGRVTSVVPFGAFVDLGGIDGLVHISRLGAGGYVEKPEDVVQPGQTVRVRVVEADRDRTRVGLSMRDQDLRGAPDRPRPHEEAPTPTPTVEPQPEIAPTAPATEDDEPTVMGERLMGLGMAPPMPPSPAAPATTVDPEAQAPEHKTIAPSITLDARQSGGVRPPLQPGAIIEATVSTINRAKFKMTVKPQTAPEETVQVSNVTFTDMQNIQEGDTVRVQLDKDNPRRGTLKRKG